MFRFICVFGVAALFVCGAFAEEPFDVELERTTHETHTAFHGLDRKERVVSITVDASGEYVRDRIQIEISRKDTTRNIEFPRPAQNSQGRAPVYGLLSVGSDEFKLVAQLCRDSVCRFKPIKDDEVLNLISGMDDVNSLTFNVFDPHNDQVAIRYMFLLPKQQKQSEEMVSAKPVAAVSLPKPQSTDPVYAICNKEHLVRTYFDCACFAAEAPKLRSGVSIEYSQEIVQLERRINYNKQSLAKLLAQPGGHPSNITRLKKHIADAEARLAEIKTGSAEKSDEEIYAQVLISGTCKNPSAVAAHEKKQCLGSSTTSGDKENPEQFCACVGEKTASAWSALPTGKLNSRVLVSLGANARLTCQ